MSDNREAIATLERDLGQIFGGRLQSLVAYGEHARDAGPADEHNHGHGAPAPAQTLVIVEGLGAADLDACARRMTAWHETGLATPLVLAAHEFERSLDAFPFEFGAIIADHRLIAGTDPFNGARVETADLRRACEVQARSHLLHLREGYLDTCGNRDALAVLIVESAPAFAALLRSIARLKQVEAADAGAAARHAERTLALDAAIASAIVKLVGVREITGTEATRLFAPYLDAIERIVRWVDSL
jgi:hypothetical protein